MAAKLISRIGKAKASRAKVHFLPTTPTSMIFICISNPLSAPPRSSLPLLQNWPPQLVSQRHCHGSLQVPWTQPGCGMHLSQYWPCHPYWHLQRKRAWNYIPKGNKRDQRLESPSFAFLFFFLKNAAFFLSETYLVASCKQTDLTKVSLKGSLLYKRITVLGGSVWSHWGQDSMLSWSSQKRRRESGWVDTKDQSLGLDKWIRERNQGEKRKELVGRSNNYPKTLMNNKGLEAFQQKGKQPSRMKQLAN